MLKVKLFLAACLVMVLGACSEVGETTAVGAATGGVIGAGLGAVVGSQTGSPGAGIAIGAVAGASAGAAIGRSLEEQDESLQAQDETIRRQDQRLAAQRGEIEELRRGSREPRLREPSNYDRRVTPPSYSSRTTKPTLDREHYANKHGFSANERTYAAKSRETSSSVSRKVTSSVPATKRDGNVVSEKTLVVPDSNSGVSDNAKNIEPAAKQAAALSHRDTEVLAEPDAETTTKTVAKSEATKTESAAVAVASTETASSDDCDKAAGEVRNAERVQEPADRLFHFRRALRLCPKKPDYHNRLGEAYLSLNRKADAEYEFKEALNIDPSFRPAKENLSTLR